MTAAERERRPGKSSADLLWGMTARTSRGPKPSLTRDQIARAGIAIADAEGLDGFSMRAVAERLGFTTMSLYRHVPDKTTLLAMMIDTAIGDALPLADRAGGWRPRLADWARQNRALFTRHPWLLHAVVPGSLTGPWQIAWIEAGLQIMAETGIPLAEAMEVALFVYGYVHGMANLTHMWTTDDLHAWEPSSPLMQRVAHDDRFPRFRAMLAAGIVDAPEGAANAEAIDEMGASFEFGLQRALDGIEALIQRRASAPGQGVVEPATGSSG